MMKKVLKIFLTVGVWIVLVGDITAYGGNSVSVYTPLYGNELMTQLGQTGGYINQQFYSFSNNFRIFIPPGMRSVNLSLIADNLASVAAVSRFRQYPYYTLLPSSYPQGALTLEDARSNNQYSLSAEGMMMMMTQNYGTSAMPADKAGWLYVDLVNLGGGSIRHIDVSMAVDIPIFSAWYAANIDRYDCECASTGTCSTPMCYTVTDYVQFVEGDPPVKVADQLTVSGVTSGIIKSAKVSILNSQEADKTVESLTAATGSQFNIHQSYDSATGVLTLDGIDSVEHYQQVLRSITYNNTSANPNPLARIVTIQITSSDGTTRDISSTTLNVKPVNNPPTLTLPGGGLSYESGAGALVLNENAFLSDVDSQNFDGGEMTVKFTAGADANDKLAIQNGGDNGKITISGENVAYQGQIIGTFSGGTSSVPMTFRFNAYATPDTVQSVVRSLTYENTATISTLNNLKVEIVITDGDGGTSLPSTQEVVVSPELARISYFIEGKGAVNISPDGTIISASAISMGIIKSARVMLMNPLDQVVEYQGNGVVERLPAEILKATIEPPQNYNITPSYDQKTGILMLEGLDTVANYEQVLHQTYYNNISENPSKPERIFSFEVTGAEGNVVKLSNTGVYVVPADNPPFISLANEIVYFYAGDGVNPGNPVLVDKSYVMFNGIIDVDYKGDGSGLQNYNGGSLTVQFDPGDGNKIVSPTDDDYLAVQNNGSISITTDNKLLYNGQIIGTVEPYTAQNGLVIHFNENAAADSNGKLTCVQAAVDAVFYGNKNPKPTVNVQRLIRYTLYDGGSSDSYAADPQRTLFTNIGKTSSSATKVVEIVSENNQPFVLDIPCLAAQGSYYKTSFKAYTPSDLEKKEQDFSDSQGIFFWEMTDWVKADTTSQCGTWDDNTLDFTFPGKGSFEFHRDSGSDDFFGFYWKQHP